MNRIFKIVTISVSIILIGALVVCGFVASQRYFLKKAYPIAYSEYVEKYCSERNLDPMFVYAVIWNESNFSPTALSSVGARGLMQVTEDTFDWVKNKLGDRESTFDDMYNPETAVKYGTYLISYLKQTLGSEENLLCGYHAGVNRAVEWTKDENISTDGQIDVQKIPYPDTKQYVNKVMKTYKMYQKLYK